MAEARLRNMALARNRNYSSKKNLRLPRQCELREEDHLYQEIPTHQWDCGQTGNIPAIISSRRIKGSLCILSLWLWRRNCQGQARKFTNMCPLKPRGLARTTMRWGSRVAPPTIPATTGRVVVGSLRVWRV